MGEYVDREDRRTENRVLGYTNTETLGRGGIGKQEDSGEAAPSFSPSLVCYTVVSGPSSCPGPESLPLFLLGLDRSFPLYGWPLLTKCYHLWEAFLITFAQLSTPTPACLCPIDLFYFLQRIYDDHKSFYLSVYLFIIWPYLHHSEINLHKARTQTVFSLGKIRRRWEFAKAIRNLCEEEETQSSLGGLQPPKHMDWCVGQRPDQPCRMTGPLNRTKTTQLNAVVLILGSQYTFIKLINEIIYLSLFSP